MKFSLLLIPLFILSCATSDIAVNREIMQSVKTVAIVPFTSTANLKKEIFAEAEANFRSALVKLNYKVVERDKLDGILKWKDASAELTVENVKKIGKLAGAEAVLFGEIIKHEEKTEEVMFYHGFMVGNKLSNKSHDELKYITTYKFQIAVRLVDVSDGSTILTMKNNNKEMQEIEHLQCCNSLDSFRRYILNKMANELVESLKEKN